MLNKYTISYYLKNYKPTIFITKNLHKIYALNQKHRKFGTSAGKVAVPLLRRRAVRVPAATSFKSKGPNEIRSKNVQGNLYSLYTKQDRRKTV